MFNWFQYGFCLLTFDLQKPQLFPLSGRTYKESPLRFTIMCLQISKSLPYHPTSSFDKFVSGQYTLEEVRAHLRRHPNRECSNVFGFGSVTSAEAHLMKWCRGRGDFATVSYICKKQLRRPHSLLKGAVSLMNRVGWDDKQCPISSTVTSRT